MNLFLKDVSIEIEQRLKEVYESPTRIRIIEEVLHELLKPLEQHIGSMECAAIAVNKCVSNKWIDRRLNWI